MGIKYSLYENKLSGGQAGDYIAHVLPSGTAELADVVEHMIYRRSTLRKADILAVLEEYHSSIIHYLLEGKNVTTPVTNFAASIRGRFEGEEDTYDASRHTLDAVLNSGSEVRHALGNGVQVSKQEANRRAPRVKHFYDTFSGERDGKLTPGGTGRVTGRYLKFDANDEVEGVYLINGTETKVSLHTKTLPSELIFMIPPALAPGDYVLEVRARLDSVTEVRSGVLESPVTVA